MISRGAALVDATGGLRAADEGFARALGLGEGGPAALRDRAAREPALAAALGGEGPARAALEGAGGERLVLERLRAPDGWLLVLHAVADQERLEHAGRSAGLPLLAGGLSHDVNGPLNTMTLQLALLEEKLADGAAGAVAAPHLGALREQVARVARLVRRFRQVVDPSPGQGGLDLGAVAGDALALLTHDLNRRSVRLQAALPAGQALTGAPPERAVRLVLGLLLAAVAATPEGGALAVEARADGPWATLSVVHPAGANAPEVGYDGGVAAAAAAALEGRLERSSEEGRERVTLRLPREAEA